MERFGILYAFLFFTTSAEGSYENSIVLTTVPVTPLWPNTHHIYFLPGTPYDYARNESLYSASYKLKKTNQLSAELHGCKVDYSRKVLYVYDQFAARIEAIPNLDWANNFSDVSSVIYFHKGVSYGYVKIAVDWVSHNVYWTDPMFRWIAMQPGYTADSSLYKIIVKENLERPFGLAVDPIGRYIFWTELTAPYPKIERASLTGEDRQAIISSGLLFPICIDVDVSGSYRRIYWADTTRETIESANLEGGDRRIIKRISNTVFFDMALFRDVLSVIDVSGNQVFFINKINGRFEASPYRRPYEIIWGICMYDDETQPVLEDFCAKQNCSDICVNKGGHAVCLCREGFKHTGDGHSCIEDTSKYHRAVILSNSKSIYLVDIRCLTAVFTSYAHKLIYTSTFGQIKFLTVDMIERKIIFATDTDIYALAVDMTVAAAQRITTSQEIITGLSIDWIDKNVYWTSGTTSGRISVVSEDGDNVYTLQTGLDHPRGLKVLALEMKMVWIAGTGYNTRIEISNLNGTDKKIFVHSFQLKSPKSLDFDSHTNELYWVDSGYINRININGSGSVYFPNLSVSPNLLLIYQDYLVWTEDEAGDSIIKRKTIRNSRQEVYSNTFSNIGTVEAMSVLDQTLQPLHEGPCEADNGGCEHICVPIGKSRKCLCEYGFLMNSNGRSCSSEPFEDNFLLVTDLSHNKIYQVSLVEEDVRAVDVERTGNPNAVIYNPATQKVIWSDKKDQALHSAYLNGSDHKLVYHNGAKNAYANRITIDSTSGNMYYTSAIYAQNMTGFVGVSVISPKGDHLEIVAEGYTPRDIVVDPEAGLMFWTDVSTVPCVKRANMDGTAISVIISTNIALPNGLAIDYQAKKLYLTDGVYNNIRRCAYDGYCSVIYTDKEGQLMDIDLSGDYLYFTAWNKPYITKMNKGNSNDVSLLATNADLGRLDSISVYRSLANSHPVNDDCFPNGGTGDCSTLCLPTGVGRTCTCPDGVTLWPNSNVCSNFPRCTSYIQNGQLTDTCSFLHMATCSYSCKSPYEPAVSDSKMTCHNGQWSRFNPCILSNKKCPASVDNVMFESSCSLANGVTCKYKCVYGYNPTSASGTMTCDRGIWDNSRPCQKNTTRTTATTATITTPSSTTTTPSSTTSTSSAKPLGGTTDLLVRSKGPSVVPIAAGAGAGGLVLVVIIVLLLIVKFKRSSRQAARSGTDHQFETPCNQGFVEHEAVGSMSPESKYQRNSYDLIIFEEPDFKDSSSTDNKSRQSHLYTTTIIKRDGIPLSGVNETLNGDSSNYLKPDVPTTTKSENFI